MSEEKKTKEDIVKNEKEFNALINLLGVKKVNMKLKYHKNKRISDKNFDKYCRKFEINDFECSCCFTSRKYFKYDQFVKEYGYIEPIYKFIKIFLNYNLNYGGLVDKLLIDETLFKYFYYNFITFRIFLYHYKFSDHEEEEIEFYLRKDFGISEYYDMNMSEIMATLIYRLLFEYSAQKLISPLNFEFDRYIDEIKIKMVEEKEYNMKRNKAVYVENRLKDFSDEDLDKIVKYMNKMENKKNNIIDIN